VNQCDHPNLDGRRTSTGCGSFGAAACSTNRSLSQALRIAVAAS
jgi:hypothetical protein